MQRFTFGIVCGGGDPPPSEDAHRERLSSRAGRRVSPAARLLLWIALALTVFPLLGGRTAFAQTYSLPYTYIPRDAEGTPLPGDWVHAYVTVPQAYAVEYTSVLRHQNVIKFHAQIVNPSGTLTSWSDVVTSFRTHQKAPDGFYYDVAQVAEHQIVNPVLSPQEFNKYWENPFNRWERLVGPLQETVHSKPYWLGNLPDTVSFERNVPAGDVWIVIRSRFAASIRGDVTPGLYPLNDQQKTTLRQDGNYRLVLYFARWKTPDE